jgi:hypothetical protein
MHAAWFNISTDENTVGMFQKFFDLILTQTNMHVQEDEVYAVHVCANWHITEATSSYYSNHHFV